MTESTGRPFVHLHVKSQYSLLGALGSPADYVKLAKSQGMSHLALTDEMNLFGAVEFYKKATDAGVHPIVGAELIVAPGSRADGNRPRENTRLVALVRSPTGYVALNHLVSEGYLSGRHYVPRIDKELLTQHRDLIGEGLILLSGDLRSELARLLARDRWDDAERAAEWYRDIAGHGNYYLELMDLGWGAVAGGMGGEADQRVINDKLRELGRKLDIPLVVTNNVHYPKGELAFNHEVLLCLGMQNKVGDEFRFRFPSDQFFLKSPEQMYRLFEGDEEALANTVAIAERCSFDFDFETYHFPVYPHLEGRTPEAVLRDLTYEGLEPRLEVVKRRFDGDDWEAHEQVYKDRVEEELGIIEQMGFAAYFLIVYDFISWAKDNDIAVGPGRGSGAGSLVLYSLRITDIDPIPYDLLFERFLNPERVSMPDVDVDFCQDRRGEVIDYVNAAYGGETRVTQIITFGKMLAKGVLRDAGRVMGFSFGEVDKIAKLVPEKLGIKLHEAVAQEPKLRRLMAEDPKVDRLIRIALGLEGTARHASVHAAGVVIADDDLRRYCPLYKGAGDSDPGTTQFDMKWAEEIGLIKFDFLGLKTLTQIKNALDMARAAGKTKYDFFAFNDVPLDDAAVYSLLARGDTLGVFQLESSGMQELLRGLRPTCFEDIIAVAALYRPGPMGLGMHTAFVERKHGRERVIYPHNSLKPILETTHGVIVFQEQVMQIAQVMGGYSLGQADLLRRAMGKKKQEVMDEQRVIFKEGAAGQGIAERKADEVFDLMAEFAKYGFNKSHTAAYGLVAYQTAWIKHHLPAEFYASLLTIESANTDKVLLYMDDARRHSIKVLPPDVNESQRKFTVVGDNVRFGLTAVKGVGDSAIAAILEARDKVGRFERLEDFLDNIDPRRVNKSVLEALIKCGAFWTLGYTRAELFDSVERMVEYMKRKASDRNSGQVGLFGGAVPAGRLNIPSRPEWPERKRLAMEKEALGFYTTGHPMSSYEAEIETFSTHTTAQLPELRRETEVRLAGIAAARKIVTTKASGKKMAFVSFEDMLGSVELTVFPRLYAKTEELLDNSDEPLLVKAKIDDITEEGLVKLIADEVRSLAEVREAETSIVRFRFGVGEADETALQALGQLVEAHPGGARSKVVLATEHDTKVTIVLPERFHVRPSTEMMEAGELAFGRQITRFS
jgi:DNA polymerase III subunit alpha